MSDEKKLPPSMRLAWDLYIAHIFELIDAQREAWIRHQPVGPLVLTPPSTARINIIEAALRKAIDEGIHEALLPVIRLCDEIDNEPDIYQKRTKLGRHLHARVNELYRELQALKSSSVAVAT